MGLVITGKSSKIELSGGYGMLLTIRELVAKAFDKELGEHYATLRFTIGDFEKFDEITNKILSNKRFNNEDVDVIDFLFATDCGGKINYKTCKKIYELIKNIKVDVVLRYRFYSNNDLEDFKQLLKDCYSNRCNLTWS